MVATVSIWDNLIGYVTWDESRKHAIMEFDSSFVNQNLDISPVHMPLSQLKAGNYVFSFPSLPYETYKGLPGMLADSLPDNYGNMLLNTFFARQGRDPQSITPVERLCYVAERGMGALEYKPAMQRAKDKSEVVNMADMVAIASEILNRKKALKTNLTRKQEEALKDIIRVGTSAGGARAKAIIAYNIQTGEVRSGQIKAPEGFTYWLLKFDGVSNQLLGDPKGYGKIEFAYYKMATSMGIDMNESRLLEENGRAHFITRRFDRTKDGEKHHMQTLCGIAHFDYNNPGVYSYEQAFQVMRNLKLHYSDAEQMFRRMVFNIIARNQDDHTKNISFLMNKKGHWKLAPAYDVAFSYNPSSRWTSQHQMSVNGKRDDFNLSDILAVGKQMNIKNAKEIIEQSIYTISKWAEFAKESGVMDKQIAYIKTMHRLKLA
jgi:serine/threonine-protein kinase HipA